MPSGHDLTLELAAASPRPMCSVGEVADVMDPLTAEDLRAGIDNFIASLNPGDTVVIYYAGHGIQSKGRNYLVPADLPASESSVLAKGLAVDALLADVRRKAPGLTLLMLDACRNNPLAVGASGLASMESTAIGTNTWIEFAAEPNKTAEDGAFMRHLLDELPKPGISLSDLFVNVRRSLLQTSKIGQSTRSTSNITVNNFYFIAGDAVRVESPMSVLERIAETMPRAEAGQTKAVETIIRSGQSLAATPLLQGLSLTKAQLDGARLSEARMMGADLTGASLKKADLASANLALAVLDRANVNESRLEGAAFTFADAEGTDFSGARAADARWVAVRAPKVVFRNADLRRAGFMFADLRGAAFDGASLAGAVFIGSDLTGATFENATLDNTDFTGSVVDGVSLTPAQMQGACETPRSAGGERISITVFEITQNANVSGGQDYRTLVERAGSYTLETNGLPTCRRREVKDGVWYPIRQSGGREHIRGDLALRLSEKFLSQAGRRTAVRNRVEGHFDWLWKALRGQ